MTGIVLAGGQSSRMGQNKSLLELEGRSLIEHVCSILDGFCDQLIISSNSTEFSFLPFPVVKDEFFNCGPMAGIHAVMKAFPDEWYAVLATDTPFVTAAIFENLIAISGTEKIVVSAYDNNLHPLIGIYNRAVLEKLEIMLKEGNYKLRHFIKQFNSKILTFDLNSENISERNFFNINTPQDYQAINPLKNNN